MGLIDNTTWSGKQGTDFYSTALLTGDSRKLFRKELNVKSTKKISSLDMGAFLQADACTLDPSGNYTLAQKTLTVCAFGFKIPFCTLDWEDNYLSESLAAGANAVQNFPKTAIDYIFMKIQEGISEQLEDITFQGDTEGSPASLCDGLQKGLLADATVIDVAASSPGGLASSTTVIAQLTRIYNAIPATVRRSRKAVLMVNIATAAAYQLALANANPALVGYNQGDYSLKFIDLPIVVCPGLGDDKAICCDPFNLVWGTDLVNDEMEIKFIADPNNPKTSYAHGSFKFGVLHLVGAEIVYYN